MNDITIKLTCPCGAGFELTADEGNRSWLRAQALDWQGVHRRCVPHGQRLTLPEGGECATTRPDRQPIADSR